MIFNNIRTLRKCTRIEKSLCLLCFYIFIYSCGNSQIVESNKLDACVIARETNTSFNMINGNIKSILKNSTDTCVFSLIDFLASRAIRLTDTSYLHTLNVICNAGDGYVSEYYLQVSDRLFHKDFKDLFTFLYYHGVTKDGLYNSVIQSVSMKLSESANPVAEKAKINEFMKSRARLYGFNSRQFDFLIQMQQKFNYKCLIRCC